MRRAKIKREEPTPDTEAAQDDEETATPAEQPKSDDADDADEEMNTTEEPEETEPNEAANASATGDELGAEEMKPKQDGAAEIAPAPAEDSNEESKDDEAVVKKEGEDGEKTEPGAAEKDATAQPSVEDPSKNPYAPPGSPAAAMQGGYGAPGGYGMPMYGHHMYPPPYGYGVPPGYGHYYPNGYPGYAPPHMMHAPPGYDPAVAEAGTSPARGRYSYHPHHPYPPASPVVSPAAAGDASAAKAALKDGQGHDGEEKDAKAVSPSRIKVYVKPRVQASQEVMDRRSRKNAQSRSRAAKFRVRVGEIERKPPEERTEEEKSIYEQYQSRRQRKNDRSRERALEKKEEIDRILAKPEKKRTRIEVSFLESALNSKKRKNEGDRLRRQRLKELGLSPKGNVGKPGITARGPLPHEYTDRLVQGGFIPPPPGYVPPHMMPPPPHYQGHPHNSPPGGPPTHAI